MKQIYEYVPVYLACGGSELEALDDIFSKKVLRKLEAQSLTHVKLEAGGLINTLETVFGTDSLPQCVAYIEHLIHTIA